MVILQKIINALTAQANPSRAVATAHFFPGMRMRSLGLSVPQIRVIEKKYFLFPTQSRTELLKNLDTIWHATDIFEVRSAVLIYLQRHKTANDLTTWRTIRRWAATLDNWEHSDRLSDLFNDLLQRYPAPIYAQLVKWNHSKHPWERRQSLVSLLYYFRSNRMILSQSKIFPLITRLLHDAHPYVQKAVGWTLREVRHAYPEATWTFLQKHAAEISPIAWYAATEKLDLNKKKLLLRLRKIS